MPSCLPSLSLEHSSVQLKKSDHAASPSTCTDQRKMLKVAAADLDAPPVTPCGSQSSHPSPSQASIPESQCRGTPLQLSPRIRTDVPRCFLCPISLDLMKDPVILVETMQTYDRTSICRWFDWGGATCPVSGKQLDSQELVNNPALRVAINEWRESGWKHSVRASKKVKGKKQPSTYAHLKRPPPANNPSVWHGETGCTLVPVSKHCSLGHSPAFVIQNMKGSCTPASLRRPTFPPKNAADCHEWKTLMEQCPPPQMGGIGAALANEVFHRRATVYDGDHAGWTALHWAAKEDDLRAVQLLIQLGAHPQQASTKEVFMDGMRVTSGVNPLHVAAIFGSVRAAQALMEYGANPEAMCNFETPMHLAVRHGHAAVIKVLAWNGANVNACNGLMDTPLHLAIVGGDASVVEVLVRCGADAWAVNGQGKNAPELVTDRCNYFDDFSNLSPLDEFKMMELLELSPTVGVSLY